jgi:ferrous iron transport protein B
LKQELTVALVGNPNSGKTSLFNALTGLNHKVSNFPGTTVDRKTGSFRLAGNTRVRITDLPGTYSLYPKSADELVTYELLRDHAATQQPDVVLFIADASNLKRNLLLLSQVADLGVPVILALNMVDLAEKKGIFYDTAVLSEALKIPVIQVNARKRNGVHEIKKLLEKSRELLPVSYFDPGIADPSFLDNLRAATGKQHPYAAVQYAITAQQLNLPGSQHIKQLFAGNRFDATAFQQREILERYHRIDEAVRLSRKEKPGAAAGSFTKKADSILIHRVYGIIIFLALLFLIFQAIFSWSAYPMEWVETGFGAVGEWVGAVMPEGILSDLIVNGVLAGLSGVIVFLPQIMILFAFIALLEDIGYMARVGFIMDRIMKPFGMNGKSVVPLISGMACAVPSIMASRSIENKKERLITVLVTPLMSCSARLPVYTLLIAMLVPEDASWGPFNLHGIILMLMYLLGFAAVLVSAFILRFFIRAESGQYFLMELPGYKLPVLRNMLITLYHKGSAFVWGAGKIIVAVSIILWALASFGPGDTMQTIDEKYTVLAAQQDLSFSAEEIESRRSAEKLQASYAGEFGRFIEPAIRPLGFDWKIGIALVTSLAAREVFVGTMNTIYSVGGNTENLESLRTRMQQEINPLTGNPVFSMATVLSLMVFYAFALQCISTVSVVRSETGSWKWTMIQFVYMTALAYLSSYAVYHILSGG